MRPDAVRVPSSDSSRRTPPGNLEITLAARSDACVFLTGAAEAAREFAYRLHLASGWRHGPFTVIDCRSADSAFEARLVETLFEPPDSPGVLQLRLAQAGTVLLQEVNHLPLEVQRALSAWLTDWVGPRGRTRRRLMASSSEPLFDCVRAGTFDDSLYYRLNTIHFFVPAGRERRQP